MEYRDICRTRDLVIRRKEDWETRGKGEKERFTTSNHYTATL
jgi:hypothetical protein